MALTDDTSRQVFLHPTDRRKRQKRLYGSAKWERVRARVLARDNYLCQVQASKKCRVAANTVDHIIRPEEGGATYDEANLRASCRSCNMVRHNAAYFREKVDAAAASQRAGGRVVPVPSSRPASSDIDRYLLWATSLPAVSGEPQDHGHSPWPAVSIHTRQGIYRLCPPSCRRAPVRWRTS